MYSKDNDSLDEQFNHAYRQRPKMSWFKKLITGITLSTTAMFTGVGCGPMYDLGHVRSPRKISEEVSNYQDKLKELAKTMGIYDEKNEVYYIGTTIAEAEAGGVADLDTLLVIRAAISSLKSEAEGDLSNKLNDLEKKYQGLIEDFHSKKTSETGLDDIGKEKHILALEVFAYGNEDFNQWRGLVDFRKESHPDGLELGDLGPADLYNEVTTWHPDSVRKAHSIRAGRNRKHAYWITPLVTFLAGFHPNLDWYGLYGEEPIDNGGEYGGEGGR